MKKRRISDWIRIKNLKKRRIRDWIRMENLKKRRITDWIRIKNSNPVPTSAVCYLSYLDTLPNKQR